MGSHHDRSGRRDPQHEGPGAEGRPDRDPRALRANEEDGGWGEVLFRVGDASCDFVVVLEGEVEVVDDFAGEARVMGVMRPGRFLGELNMLTGQGLYLSAVVRVGGEVLAISRERLKEVVTEEPDLSDIILKAFMARRAWGMRTGLGLRIIGSRQSGDATRLREFAARNRQQFFASGYMGARADEPAMKHGIASSPALPYRTVGARDACGRHLAPTAASAHRPTHLMDGQRPARSILRQIGEGAGG